MGGDGAPGPGSTGEGGTNRGAGGGARPRILGGSPHAVGAVGAVRIDEAVVANPASRARHTSRGRDGWLVEASHGLRHEVVSGTAVVDRCGARGADTARGILRVRDAKR